jgi:hypothetical protein
MRRDGSWIPVFLEGLVSRESYLSEPGFMGLKGLVEESKKIK